MSLHRVVLVAALALLALPSGASANHLVATTSISGKLGKAKRSGFRTYTVTWNATCGDPAASATIEISRVITPKRRTRKPVVLPELDAEEQGPGTAKLRISAGTRFVPRIDLECSSTDEAGNSHEARASSTGEEVFLRPQLLSYTITNTTQCGIAIRKDPNLRRLQAGQQSQIEPAASYNSVAMLRRPSRIRKTLRLRIRGAGLDARVKPVRGGFGIQFILPKPKRAGKVRIWLVFDGTPSTKLTIRVLSRKGC